MLKIIKGAVWAVIGLMVTGRGTFSCISWFNQTNFQLGHGDVEKWMQHGLNY